MQALLNITYAGQNGDYVLELEASADDETILRICDEVVRNGEVKGLTVSELPHNAFRNFVVDRFPERDGMVRLVVRPKVPFGG